MSVPPPSSARRPGARRLPRRLGVAAAKARLPQVLRDVASGPTIIHNRGRDVAVLVSIADYEALAPGGGAIPVGRRALDALRAWRAKYGGVEFEPEPARVVPRTWMHRAR